MQAPKPADQKGSRLTILHAIAICINLSYKAIDVLAFCFSGDSPSYPLDRKQDSWSFGRRNYGDFRCGSCGLMKFPIDALNKRKVIKAFEALGFKIVRAGNHISMIRENPDSSSTPLTMPNHEKIKGSTLRTICTQAGIPRDEFLETYEKG